MAAADGPAKKNSSYYCLFSQHLVRDRQLTIPLNHAHSRDRVCGITMARVVTIAQLNSNDLTYGYAKVSILTNLEPCMGLIVACLPMFPPTFKRMLRGKETSDSRSYTSSSVARLRSKDSKRPAFHQIDDLYPLTNLEEFRTQNDITGPDGKPDAIVDDPSINAKLEMYPQSTIKIKKGWEVRSDEAV